MESIVSFIKEEKKVTEENILKSNENLNQCNYEIEEIDNMIIELSKSIDTTYEIFSPNAFDKDNNVVEIEKLKYKKISLLEQTKKLEKEIAELQVKKKKIDNAIDEVNDVEEELANSVRNTKYLINKEKSKLNDNYFNEITLLLENQISKDNHYITSLNRKNLEIIQNKFQLCENLIDIDINRAKIEMNRIHTEIKNIEKSCSLKMFHVKHFQDNIGLYKSINDFIQEYKKHINMNIEFKYFGLKITENGNKVINIIRIIKEAIDNANEHSNGNIISINIVIDKIENTLESNNENENNLHQINFVVKNDNSYNVNICIADNGEGFTVQDDNVLNENNLHGISIMKYRTKLINGNINFDSTPGLGTTVKLVYVSLI